MRSMRFLVLMLLAAGNLSAGAISDAESSVLLHQGDSLIFQIQTSSFSYNAARFGLAAGPTDIGFSFISAPGAASGTMSLWLDQVPLSGALTFTDGQYTGSQYRGAVSTLQAFLHLTPGLSTQILSSAAIDLTLRNEGADLVLGLPPNSLRQDLSVSLTGGPLTVGALATGVTLDSAPEPAPFVLILLPAALMIFARFRRVAQAVSPANRPIASLFRHPAS
jgi:hypothetical protein